jgi:purine nucleosidase
VRALCLLVIAATLCAAQPERVIFDTDCAFFNDDGAALVMLLQEPQKMDVIGLTIVPGNLWPLDGAEYMFRILDLMKRAAVPLYLGARAPLVHTKGMAEKENREWGPVGYMGAFGSEPGPVKKTTERRASRRHAVDFMIDALGQTTDPVTVLAIGPMTNLAMAIRLRPDLERRIKRLVFMGGSVHDRTPEGRAAEFNFWFDPEAAHIVLTAHWPRIDVTTVDISIKAEFTQAMVDEISKSPNPAARYIAAWSQDRYYLWDELAACAWLDPSIITKEKQTYMDVDLSHGPSYGDTLTWTDAMRPATGVQKVHAQLDLDLPKFTHEFVELMSAPPQGGRKPGE